MKGGKGKSMVSIFVTKGTWSAKLSKRSKGNDWEKMAETGGGGGGKFSVVKKKSEVI